MRPGATLGLRQSTAHRSRAFTLVEVLVAVLVFGLLAAIAYTGLQRVAGGVDQLDGRAEQLAELQRAVASLDHDLRQLVSRAARAANGRVRPALDGAPDRWIGHRSGRFVPDGQGSVIQTVAWSCAPGGRLVRHAGPNAAAELALGQDPHAVHFAVDCRSLRLRYRDAVGQWHDRWPVANEPAGLPAAIDYALDSERHGLIRRLIVL